MKHYAILTITTLFEISLGFSAQPGCFRAAILDQVLQVDESAVKTVELNLELYDRSAKLAKENGADIIVFAEDGILGVFDRDNAHIVGETVPDHQGQFCDGKYATSNRIIHRLSCISSTHKIYIAANLIDIQPCSNSTNDKNHTCPHDGFYAFNTAVLFDKSGTLLAKYHKIHLFGELSKNPAIEEKLVYVKTEIGNLGLQVCFDLLYKTPGHLMAKQKLIDTLLFPTSWVEESPFLTAVQAQLSWSLNHKVNLLAANIHHPQASKKGSGIYVGSTQKFEVVNYLDASTRLLIANLPIKPELNVSCSLNVSTFKIPMKSPEYTEKDPMYYFKINMNLNDTKLKKLEVNKSEAETCFGGVCCHLKYQMDEKTIDDDDQFYLLAGNRTKPGPFPFVEEFCALIHCPGKFFVCSDIRSDHPLASKFYFAHLEGSFHSNTTVLPSVVGSQHQLMKLDKLWSFKEIGIFNEKQKWQVNVGNDMEMNTSLPLGTVALYGRAFDRDPLYVQRGLGDFNH